MKVGIESITIWQLIGSIYLIERTYGNMYAKNLVSEMCKVKNPKLELKYKSIESGRTYILFEAGKNPNN